MNWRGYVYIYNHRYLHTCIYIYIYIYIYMCVCVCVCVCVYVEWKKLFGAKNQDWKEKLSSHKINKFCTKYSIFAKSRIYNTMQLLKFINRISLKTRLYIYIYIYIYIYVCVCVCVCVCVKIIAVSERSANLSNKCLSYEYSARTSNLFFILFWIKSILFLSKILNYYLFMKLHISLGKETKQSQTFIDF